MTDQTPDAAREAVVRFVYPKYLRNTVRPLLDTYAAAVSRARDAAWREGLADLRAAFDASESCGCDNPSDHAVCLTTLRDAVESYLARMDTARAGGASE